MGIGKRRDYVQVPIEINLSAYKKNEGISQTLLYAYFYNYHIHLMFFCIKHIVIKC